MIDKYDFHNVDKNGKPTSVIDARVRDYVSRDNRLFVLGEIPWIYENGVYRQDTNGARLKADIEECLFERFIKSQQVNSILKLCTGTYKLQLRYEDLNAYPPYWMNFQNGFYDTKEKKLIAHDPKYKAVNQIPHTYDPKAGITGERMEEWLRFIVPEEDDREMLLQYIGLCMTVDMRQQKFLVLTGTGGTGKSLLISLIERIVGEDNICHVPLQTISQRFASFAFLGKQLNSCADLQSAALDDTSILKQLVGQDQIRAEAKGKDAFFFRSYAKLIFSANELPLVLSEKTDGFFRRLMILKMDRRPEIQRPDYIDVLAAELPYLIQQAVQALERMYAAGKICESANSVKAVQELRKDSDTVEAWLSENCEQDVNEKTERGFLWQNYEHYCMQYGRKALTKQAFYKALRIKHFPEVKTNGGIRYFTGIKLVSGI